MEGYRTYASLIVIVLGWFGIGNIISTDNVASAINLLIQLIGIISAGYYNYKNHIQIAELKSLAGIK